MLPVLQQKMAKVNQKKMNDEEKMFNDLHEEHKFATPDQLNDRRTTYIKSKKQEEYNDKLPSFVG